MLNRCLSHGARAAAVAFTLLAVGCGGGGSGSSSAPASAPAQSSGGGQAQALSISGTPSVAATVGHAYSFQPSGSDSSGGTLSYSATNLPTWLTIDSATGLLHGTPAAGDVGTDASITISVSNGMSSSSLTPFSIVVSQMANGSAVVNWTAPVQNTDGSPLAVGSYKILYGQSAGNLSQSVTISNPSVTQYQIDNLESGTWYFSVVSVNTSGAESSPTNVASATI